MSDIFTIALLQNTLRTATPIILAGLGVLMTDHVGIMNIGMDGMMLTGAFFAVVGSFYLGSWLGGIAAALLAGVLLGLFFGVFVIKLGSDEFIIGVALNIFAGGLTVYLLRTIFGVKGAFSDPAIVPLPRFVWPWLEGIPVIGPLLSGNTLLVYVSWALVLVCWLVIYRTPLGFWLRAAGEHPLSLRSAGISPERMKYLASLLCGVFAGLAGAHLSLGYLTMFTENMSAARGFIAVACVIFGAGSPPRVFLAALLFGFIDALGLRLQSANVNSNLTAMAPYLVTVVMMAVLVVRTEARKKRQIQTR
ncbi:MAG: ABC transporter permease [Firmicutes bacterium]|nr:ABC transporter permease [Bacillota bacterium]